MWFVLLLLFLLHLVDIGLVANRIHAFLAILVVFVVVPVVIGVLWLSLVVLLLLSWLL